MPYFSKPQIDEVFTSWFARLSYGNISDPYRLATYLFGSYPLFNVDSDLGLPKLIVENISQTLGVSEEQISHSFLSSLVGNFLTHVSSNGHNPQILGCRIVGQIRRKYGQQFCPQCLKDDAQPYFRKQWRLTYFTVCLKHGIVLSDRCMGCSSPVNYHKLTFFHAHIAYCYNCGRDLYNQTEYPIFPEDPIAWLQSKLDQGYSTGWIELNQSTTLRTPLFLDGIRYILQSWVSSRSSEYLVELISNFRKEKLRRLNADGINRRVSKLSVLQRYRLLNEIAWLLIDWPDRFVRFCKEKKLTHTLFYKTDRYPPYWLHSVFYWELSKKNYWVSLDEIKSAGRFLYKRRYRITPGNLAECVGLDRSMHITRDRQRYINRLRCLQKYHFKDLNKVFNY